MALCAAAARAHDNKDSVYSTNSGGRRQVTLGLIPGFNGTVRLPRRIGLGAATEWTLTGDLYW
jgi:hypothetical protein